VNADDFRHELATMFPEVVAATRLDERGLLHCEVAAFRRCSEEAMDGGKAWFAERHFRLVADSLTAADDELRNALEVSYLEDLALGGWTAERHRIIRQRMPRVLREELIRIAPQWR
jgi:hypothetical protein